MACVLEQRFSLKKSYQERFYGLELLSMASGGDFLEDGAPQQAKRMRPDPMACYLEVVEQPRATGLTFVGPDQSPKPGDFIVGEDSSRQTTTQLGIFLTNYEGPLTLVWYLAADSEQWPHPFMLEGDNCKEGVCSKTVLAKGQIIRFPGLYVRRVPRASVKTTLERRREILRSILPGREFMLKPTADYHLASARICFHALLEQQGSAAQTSKTALTRSLHCRHSLQWREPRILFISECKGSVRGNEELKLEVLNPLTNNIMVYFHEERVVPRTSWQAFAEIIAINPMKGKRVSVVVKTPPFHNQQITAPQTVSVQIRLVNTAIGSNTVKYTYTPIVRGIPRLEDRKKQRRPIFVSHFTNLNSQAPISCEFLHKRDPDVTLKQSHQGGERGERWRRGREPGLEKVNAACQTRDEQEGRNSPVKHSTDGGEFDYDQIHRYRSLMLHPMLSRDQGDEGEEKEESEGSTAQPSPDVAVQPHGGTSLPKGGTSLSQALGENQPASAGSLTHEEEESMGCEWVLTPESGIYSTVVSQENRAGSNLATVEEEGMSVESTESPLSSGEEGNKDMANSVDCFQRQESLKEEGENDRGTDSRNRGDESGTMAGADRCGDGHSARGNRDDDRGRDDGRALRPPSVTQWVDHTGAQLSILDGDVSLTIPPGALAEGQTEEIGLSVVWGEGCIPPLGPGDMNVAPVVRCSPTGLRFAQPVTLKIPHCAIKSNSWTRQMTVHCNHAKEGEKPQWERLSGEKKHEVRAEMGEQCFVLEIDHFTDFTVSLEDGEQSQAKEMALLAYGNAVTSVEEDQEVRIYIFDNLKSVTENIKQLEESWDGKIVHPIKPYHMLERRRGNMEVSVHYQPQPWLLVSPLKQVFLFRKLWNLQYYDVCKFTWENCSKISRFRCRIKVQQEENDEECFLEISNHMKPLTVQQAPGPSADHAVVSQIHKHESRQTIHAQYLCTTDSISCTSGVSSNLPQSTYRGFLGPAIDGPPPLVPFSLWTSICKQLDMNHPLDDNWKRLAEALQLDQEIPSLMSMQSNTPAFSPTKIILQLAEEREKFTSLGELRQILVNINRYDVARLIDEHEQNRGKVEPLSIEPASAAAPLPMDDQQSSPEELPTTPGTAYAYGSLACDNQSGCSRPERASLSTGPAGPGSSIHHASMPSTEGRASSTPPPIQETRGSPREEEDPYRTPCLGGCAALSEAGQCATGSRGSETDENENLSHLVQRKLTLN